MLTILTYKVALLNKYTFQTVHTFQILNTNNMHIVVRLNSLLNF